MAQNVCIFISMNKARTANGYELQDGIILFTISLLPLTDVMSFLPHLALALPLFLISSSDDVARILVKVLQQHDTAFVYYVSHSNQCSSDT